jgi:hypothetical protein
MKQKITIKHDNMDGYQSCVNFIDRIEKVLDGTKYTIYDLDVNNKQYPKNIKLESRAYLKEPNKMNIHHYRCHIHVISDPNPVNTVNGTHLEISFTLSHRFKAEKGQNKHSHIYLSIYYDTEKNTLVFDGFRKKGNISKKILENTNAEELANFLLYENYLKMINDDFELIEQPISEKKLYEKTLEIDNIRTNRYLKKSFFLLRDNLFWSKLIKFSVEQLFKVLTNLFKLKFVNNTLTNWNENNSINPNEFQNMINEIKNKHFPDEITTIPPFNKIRNFRDTLYLVTNFDSNFKYLMDEIINIHNNYFSNSQLIHTINSLTDNELKTELCAKQIKYNNLIKVFMTYIIPEYIRYNKKKVILNYNSVNINYSDIVQKIITNIYYFKDNIINCKSETEMVRFKNIYDSLVIIKDNIFNCIYFDTEIDDIYNLINIANNNNKSYDLTELEKSSIGNKELLVWN